MANTVKVKRSAVASAVPTTAALALGELAINTYDGKLFLKKNVLGVETIIDVTGGGGAGTVTAVTATAPIASSGGTAPVISMAAATTSVPGYLTAADWNTFNGKQAAGTYATGTGTASGTNTGDETTATIKTKLSITTLSGSNTGDQTIPTTLPNANAVTFATTGGAAAGSTYTGAAILTVDYSTVGAAASGHTHSYQAADGDLLAIGGLTGTSGYLKKTAADTWTLDTSTFATGTGTASGTNTGDNSANTLYASDYRAANFVAGTNYLTPTGSGASLTSLTAGNLSGTIPSAVLANSNVYIGTTAISLNRSSGALSLGGVNILGTAAGLSATLAIASGGTNSTATPTAGGVGYGTGTAHAYTAVGTSGQVLTSNGAAAPTWQTPSASSAGVTIGLTPPVSPTSGALWWDSYNGALKIYYTDADSSQWVDAFISTSSSSSIITETVFTITGTTPDISPLNGGIQTWALTGNSTPAQGTWAAGQSITLMVSDNTAYTITWSTLAVTWVGGTAPTLATTGYTIIELWKVNSTLYGAVVGDVA